MVSVPLLVKTPFVPDDAIQNPEDAEALAPTSRSPSPSRSAGEGFCEPELSLNGPKSDVERLPSIPPLELFHAPWVALKPVSAALALPSSTRANSSRPTVFVPVAEVTVADFAPVP